VNKGRDWLVGLVVLLGIALVVGGALWLGQADLSGGRRLHTTRFRTIGGLNVGAPVTLRGVKVGRVQAVRLAAGEWVEVDLALSKDVDLPPSPIVVASSASLFGEWVANIQPRDPLPEDPTTRNEILEAEKPGGEVWPGATLPDIGQLTAQANRIANDVANVTKSFTTVLDSAAVRDLRQSVIDLSAISRRLVKFADAQSVRIAGVSEEVASATADLASAAKGFNATIARLDSATAGGVVPEVAGNVRGSAADIRAAAADLRSLMQTARNNEGSVVRVVQTADSLLQRVNRGEGTLGMLATDSTLYKETAATMKQLRDLLADIQSNPKRYFKFSVF
jgi:phospholipid/cholesterol/gamma-HCH transport system substrate-binding protein